MNPGVDGRLTFYGLQAHFFSVNAQVIDRCIAASAVRVRSLGTVETAVNIREQRQKAVSHA
jgi:hypothetical protein